MMKRHAAGFTLLEVLVAFIILALTLSVIMRVFSGGLRNVGAADDYSRALLLAQSRLAELSVQPQEGEAGGDIDEKFRWRSAIHAWTNPVAAPSQRAQTLPVKLMEIKVWVAWGEDGAAREINLSTLQLASLTGPGS